MVDLAEVRYLEEVLLSAWLARDVEMVEGWAFSANDGITGRANSLTVLDQPAGALDGALDVMEAWYRARGLPSM